MARGRRESRWQEIAHLCHVVANSGFGWSGHFSPWQFNPLGHEPEPIRYGPKESMRILDALAASNN
jgi:hypothetical protein